MLKKSLIALGVAAAIPAVSFADIATPEDRLVDPKELYNPTIDHVSWESHIGTEGNQSLIKQEGYNNYAFVDQADGGESDSLIYQGGYGSHLAVVDQDGSDVDSLIKQTGYYQTAFVTMSDAATDAESRSKVYQQGGKFNDAHVDVVGSRNRSLVVQDRAYGATADVSIDGNRNRSKVFQGGIDNVANVDIVGNRNKSIAHQWGDWNLADIDVHGNRNDVISEQTAWDSTVLVNIAYANDNTVRALQDDSYNDKIDVSIEGSTWNTVHLGQGGDYGSSYNKAKVIIKEGSDDNYVAGHQTGDFNKLKVKARGDSDGNSVQSKQYGWYNRAEIDLFAVSDGNDVVTNQFGGGNSITASIDYSWENEIGVKQVGSRNDTDINLWDADYNFIAVAQLGDRNNATVDLDTDYGTVKIHQHGWNNTACSSSNGSCSYSYSY